MSVLKPVVSYFAPTTGSTIVVPAFDGPEMTVFIEPAGLLATLTVTMPSALDGQSVVIASTQVVTALTMNGGTILSGLTAFTANGFGRWGYSATATKWLRLN